MESTPLYERSRACFSVRDAETGSRPDAAGPRERLLAHGPGALSDRELLAIVLNTGIRGKSVGVLAAELSERLDRNRGVPGAKELASLPGMGTAKACSIAALVEYGRRRWGPCGIRITNPSDAYPLVRHYADRRQERFICVSLNGAHETLGIRVVTVGLVNRTIVHPREVFAEPIVDRASSILVAHNHPSGRLEPSEEDAEITRRLKTAGDLLGIVLLDHLIFSDTAYYSFLKDGRLG
jgi:DNA repair protein RadC